MNLASQKGEWLSRLFASQVGLLLRKTLSLLREALSIMTALLFLSGFNYDKNLLILGRAIFSIFPMVFDIIIFNQYDL